MRRTLSSLVTVVVILAVGQAEAQWFVPKTATPKVPTPTPTSAAKSDTFQIRYASNLNIGDSVFNISNAGTQGGSDPAGNVCANVYVFSPDEQMISCCACLVTPDALVSLSAVNDLISNTLTPARPNSIVIKLLTTVPAGANLTQCDASLRRNATLASGLRAWGTTLHALPAAGSYGVTETEFSHATLSQSELSQLESFCGFIQDDGSGSGICKSCRTGGQ
jgi:hypothetical protein